MLGLNQVQLSYLVRSFILNKVNDKIEQFLLFKSNVISQKFPSCVVAAAQVSLP